jgi:hypothetical protein
VTKLTIIRDTFQPGCTLGRMYADGLFLCHTLEDTDRFLDKKGIAAKIYASTAIGAGEYAGRVSMSNRFKRMMPEILDVPGFTGIRIHSGNTAADTEGCILVGNVRGKDKILDSRAAFQSLMEKLRGAKGFEVEIIRT